MNTFFEKRILIGCLALSTSVFLTSCATKQYPIATPLSSAEINLMNCHDLELELLRVDQMEQKINETGEFSGRTVLGFLGDFGIGNAMAKDEAHTAVFERRMAIRQAQKQKGCRFTPTAEDAAYENQKSAEADPSELETGDIVWIEFLNGKEGEMTITHVTEYTFNGFFSGKIAPSMTSRTFDKNQIKNLKILEKATHKK